MAEFRFGRVRLQLAQRTERGTELSDEELRALEWELQRALEDPMLARGLARFLDSTVFFGSDHALEMLMEKLHAGRIIVEREPEPEVDPNAGLAAVTLARLAEPGEVEADESYAVGIQLIGEDDEPVSGVRYRVTLPDGKVVEGHTGQDGRALFWGLSRPGDCKIEFPDLDAEAWENVSSVPLA